MVDTTNTWTEKLEILGRLFADYDVSVIATTRLPSKLAPSVFAELLPLMSWNSFPEYLADSQAQWLQPDILFNAIVASGLARAENIIFFDFDFLIADRFRSLASVISGLHFPSVIPVLNRRHSTANTIVSRRIGPYDRAYRLARQLGTLKSVPPAIRGFCGRALQFLRFGWHAKIDIPGGSPELDRLDALYQEARLKVPAYRSHY